MPNALAAIATAAEAGLSDEVIRAGLATFSGVKRRFQLTGTWNGVSIFDDYGHHPVEIASVLKAARAGARGRVIAVVEPHRYSRVRDLFSEFSACFRDADSVIVAPLYTAGELPIDGVDHHTLADGIRGTGHPSVIAIDQPADLVPIVRRNGRQGDMVSASAPATRRNGRKRCRIGSPPPKPPSPAAQRCNPLRTRRLLISPSPHTLAP